MIDKIFSVAALLVIGGMVTTALRPGAPTAQVIGATTHGFAWDLAAAQGRYSPNR